MKDECGLDDTDEGASRVGKMVLDTVAIIFLGHDDEEDVETGNAE